MEAAILAAGVSGADFQSAHGVRRKCLLDIGGKPMVRQVLDAVLAAECIDRIVVVGPQDVFPHVSEAGVEFAAVDDTSLEVSLSKALALLRGDGRALLVAADCPLVTGPILDAFVGRCLAIQADVCFPVASVEEMRAGLGAVRKTWYHLRDGVFAKGNAVVVWPVALVPRADRLAALFAARKEKAWTQLMGQRFAAGLAACTLDVGDVEVALSRYLGCTARAVRSAPEIVCDVDEPEDAEVVRRVLTDRAAQGPVS